MLLLLMGDPYSLLLMACPLVLLYYGGVLLCRSTTAAPRGGCARH